MPTTSIALIRGINLGSHAKVDMARLREVFTDLGHENVRTYLRSGNVVFSAADSSTIAADIQRAIATELDVDTPVVLRTAQDLADIMARNPFLGNELRTMHVTLLAAQPDAEKVAALTSPKGETAEFAVLDREVYLYCPDGYGRMKLTNAFLERRLGVSATTRNWNTITNLNAMTT